MIFSFSQVLQPCLLCCMNTFKSEYLSSRITIYPFILSPACPHLGSRWPGAYPRWLRAGGGVTPRAGCQQIAGRISTLTPSFTLTPMNNSEPSMNVTYMFLECGRKPLKHGGKRWKCPSWDSNPGTSELLGTCFNHSSTVQEWYIRLKMIWKLGGHIHYIFFFKVHKWGPSDGLFGFGLCKVDGATDEMPFYIQSFQVIYSIEWSVTCLGLITEHK